MPVPTITIRKKLYHDGRSLLAAEQLRIPVEHFVGCLVKLWILAEEIARLDGSLEGWTESRLDQHVGVMHFCKALPPEWLQRDGETIILPNYKVANPVARTPRPKRPTTAHLYSFAENNPPLPFAAEPFLELWQKWVEHRAEQKKPLTKKAVELQVKSMSQWGLERTIAALEHSIANQYQGLYEPKERNGQPVRSDSRVRSNGGYGQNTLRIGDPDPPF